MLKKWVYPRDGNNIRFTLEVINVEHSSYKIIATPVNIQGEDYGRLSFSFESGNLIGLYDIDNDDTWTERWY